jgi:hypothetical protein
MSALNSIAKISMSDMQSRQSIESHQSKVLADIYQENTNIVIWKRNLANTLIRATETVVNTQPTLEKLMVLSPQDVYANVQKTFGYSQVTKVLSEDIAQLVDMFCCLFDLKRVALRLTALDRAMCPRFHVDRVPCRLLTTYQGIATEWLPHNIADRSKLGMGNMGKSDELSGLFESASDIRQLNCGDVGLLKGELWHKNEGAGLIHRSPQLPSGSCRLLLTLDFGH